MEYLLSINKNAKRLPTTRSSSSLLLSAPSKEYRIPSLTNPNMDFFKLSFASRPATPRVDDNFDDTCSMEAKESPCLFSASSKAWISSSVGEVSSGITGSLSNQLSKAMRRHAICDSSMRTGLVFFSVRDRERTVCAAKLPLPLMCRMIMAASLRKNPSKFMFVTRAKGKIASLAKAFASDSSFSSPLSSRDWNQRAKPERRMVKPSSFVSASAWRTGSQALDQSKGKSVRRSEATCPAPIWTKFAKLRCSFVYSAPSMFGRCWSKQRPRSFTRVSLSLSTGKLYSLISTSSSRVSEFSNSFRSRSVSLSS
mmetsp:Transcript_25711/g.60279  ORF Transcript_25711/g.60279 Transcript_25711/m.60279 type:complete len:311 (+) Transcript_25711:902-1834(+)